MTFFFSGPYIPNETLKEVINERGGILIMEPEDDPAAYAICVRMMGIIDDVRNQVLGRVPRKHKVRAIFWGIYCRQEIDSFSCVVPEAISLVVPAPSPGIEFIGVSIGAIWAAMDHFHRILAHPDNLPDIGDPAKETAPEAKGLYTHSHKEKWWRLLVEPKCPIRLHAARMLTYTYLTLVVLHELSHLIDGHTDFLLQVPKPVDPLLNQALELAADANSMINAVMYHSLVQNMVQTSKKFTDPNQKVAYEETHGSIERTIHSILLSGYALWRMFDKRWDAQVQQNKTHPGPAFRAKVMADALLGQIRLGFIPCDEASFVARANEMFAWADHAVRRISGEPAADPAMWLSAFSGPAATEYFGKVNAKYVELRPQLFEFMKVDALPPIYWTVEAKAN